MAVVNHVHGPMSTDLKPDAATNDVLFDAETCFRLHELMDASIKGHRQRLRQRFSQRGFDGFHDYEVLELLLTYAIARTDVKPLAKSLLTRFGTLAGVFDAPLAELKEVHGIGEGGALFLTLIRQVEVRYLASDLPGRQLLDRPERVRAYLRLLVQGRGMECFGAMFTDQQHRLLTTQILFEGTVDRTAVYPRNLMKRALELDARGMILFHNHPGGTPHASNEDIELTRRMAEACAPLELKILDHFLIADKEVLSFREHGWF
ncbi:RadC family protein [Mariprofundus ferrooxydans]|uniref:RadC family protein n=1 Tax=Mariprofundus ferrooxydans TaxID=314344 RepID=UPI0006A6D8FD|nr:DNA repair protein RadC [Mariprofundus ferrooxydans]KON47659.1 DNA repair protein RadC [Mariprofundus ferrooxydans]